MDLFDGNAKRARSCWAVVATLTALSILGPASSNAEEFDGPSFRQGLWHFERTLEVPTQASNARYVLRKEDTTRCVDPTLAMRGTFASPNVGNCKSSKAERQSNRYTFANRCDYLGPVRTDIVVMNSDAYIEVNELNVGVVRKVDTVVAHRVGDCSGNETTPTHIHREIETTALEID
jgi:hypothetical protein